MKRDGAIQAMIGGASYSTTQFNRATQAIRMPGSAFKIFVYGAALKYGYQLNDMISDASIQISNWAPGNYKWKSKGQVSVLDGFTYSVNSVSIRLAQSIGLKHVADFAKELGIYDVSTHDFSVALGTTPVTLKDLTAAYTSFMDGISIFPYCILEIRTKSGRVLFTQKKEENNPILDKELLQSCRQILHSVIQRGTGRAAKVNDDIYGKTGTNGHSDAWFLGFFDPTENKDVGFSTGVWIGNDRNDVNMTSNSTGGRIPARIFSRFMNNINIAKDNISEKEIPQSKSPDDLKGDIPEEKAPQSKSLGDLLELNLLQ
jgi:penicillin-binding protein 1A